MLQCWPIVILRGWVIIVTKFCIVKIEGLGAGHVRYGPNLPIFTDDKLYFYDFRGKRLCEAESVWAGDYILW